MPTTFKPRENREIEMHCALCEAPFDEANDSREHVIPNAIGGRKAVRDFICRQCNNTTGAYWDNELAASATTSMHDVEYPERSRQKSASDNRNRQGREALAHS